MQLPGTLPPATPEEAPLGVPPSVAGERAGGLDAVIGSQRPRASVRYHPAHRTTRGYLTHGCCYSFRPSDRKDPIADWTSAWQREHRRPPAHVHRRGSGKHAGHFDQLRLRLHQTWPTARLTTRPTNRHTQRRPRRSAHHRRAHRVRSRPIAKTVGRSDRLAIPWVEFVRRHFHPHPAACANPRSRSSAAAWSASGTNCAYTFNVVDALRCPSRPATVRTSTPAVMSCVAT